MKGFKEVDEKAGANNDKIQQSAKEIAAVGEVELGIGSSFRSTPG